MKKMLLIAAAMLAAMGCFALPVFDGAYVFGKEGLPGKAGLSNSKKPPKDAIRIANETAGEVPFVSVYGYFDLASSWTLITKTSALAAGSNSKIKCDDNHPLSHYSAFALVAEGAAIEASAERVVDDVTVKITAITPTDTSPSAEMNNIVLFAGHGAEDYFVPSNQGGGVLNLRAMAFDKKKAQWIMLCNVENLAIGESRKVKTPFQGNLDKFEIFAIEETSGAKIECRSNEDSDDLYVFITAEGTSGTGGITGNTGSAENGKWQAVVNVEGKSAKQIYDALLMGCARMFNNANVAIEYKDAETKTIRGSSQWSEGSFSPTTYYFQFTFEAKDGRFRATFDQFNVDTGTKHMFPHAPDQKEYNHMADEFAHMASSLQRDALNSAGADDNW